MKFTFYCYLCAVPIEDGFWPICKHDTLTIFSLEKLLALDDELRMLWDANEISVPDGCDSVTVRRHPDRWEFNWSGSGVHTNQILTRVMKSDA